MKPEKTYPVVQFRPGEFWPWLEATAKSEPVRLPPGEWAKRLAVMCACGFIFQQYSLLNELSLTFAARKSDAFTRCCRWFRDQIQKENELAGQAMNIDDESKMLQRAVVMQREAREQGIPVAS